MNLEKIKFKNIFISLYILVSIGLFYAIYWANKNLEALLHPPHYINRNIPAGFLFTDQHPYAWSRPNSEKQLSISQDGRVEDEYIKRDDHFMKIKCKKTDGTFFDSKELIYYSLGGVYRSAFICEKKYYIYNYTGPLGPSLYGPFDTPSQE